MEPRVLLSGNGLVGVAALFGGFSTGFPQHTFTVTSVPQDPNNTGIVPSTAVTVVGNVVGPFNSAISAVHTTLEIDAIENGTTIGSVTWDVTTDPAGTITGPSYFGQDPNAQDEALFSVPFTLQSATLATQDVTFKITSNFGSLGVFQSDGTTPLTGTFSPAAAPPTITALSSVTTPRNTPVSSVNVTFSKPINPTTFTTAALTLTNNGTGVMLGSEVTFTTTDNTTFTIGGLSGDTAANGAYVLTVNAADIQDPLGAAGTGSQSTSFVVNTTPPTVKSMVTPAPSTSPVSSVDVTFSEPIVPTTFTTAALSLLNVNWAAYLPATPPIPGTPVPLGPGVTITTTDDTTFIVSGLQTATAAAGTYALSVNATGVQDLAGNVGTNPTAGPLTYFFSVLPGNGVVGVAAAFKQSSTTTNPHHVLITSIPQDPLNDGFVNSQNVTFDGQVWRPGLGDFTTTHMSLTINAYENDPTTGTPTVVGSVSWPDTDVPGPADFHQGGANQLNYAFFQIPVTLLSSSSTPQDVTFQVTVVPLPSGGPSGTVTWLDWQDALTTTDLHTLTATLTVDEGAPTITAISPITTPRNTPVSSVDVTFSKAIDAATFTTANLTLTRNGSAVTLGPEVTVTQVDATHFTVGGLASATTPTGSYVLTVNGAGITDLAGNAATGSQSVDFTVQSADTGPQVVSVQRFGFHAQPTSVVITFNQDLNPTSASNPNAYEILAPGTAGNVAVPIASATYDAATRTVTLVPAYRLYLYEEYMLVVRGTGPNLITDVNGVALDGKANGQPGSDYMAAFGPQDLAGPAPGTDPSKARHFPDGKSALKLSRSEASQLKHWKAIIRSGNPLIVATVKRPNSLQTRRLTIRK